MNECTGLCFCCENDTCVKDAEREENEDEA